MVKRWNSLWGEPALKTQPCQLLEEGPLIDNNPIFNLISSQITLIMIAGNLADLFAQDYPNLKEKEERALILRRTCSPDFGCHL